MRRLFPDPPGEADLDEQYASPRSRVGDRPWVGVCMITSLDGSTVVAGRSGGLSNPNDTAVLATLRRAADVILVGAATVRIEGYGPPRKPGQRLGVVTTTGAVDTTSELFTSGAGFLVMPEDGPDRPDRPDGPDGPDGPDSAVDVVRAGVGAVDLALALRRLDDVVAAPTFVQVEGGARLNGSLLDAGCIDELNLTLSPRLAGGDGSRLTRGAAPAPAGFTLAHLLVDDASFVYSRWVREVSPGRR